MPQSRFVTIATLISDVTERSDLHSSAIKGTQKLKESSETRELAAEFLRRRRSLSRDLRKSSKRTKLKLIVGSNSVVIQGVKRYEWGFSNVLMD
jgi:hypothetical protein